MNTHRQRFWKRALLVAVPLALFALVAWRHSWRPRIIIEERRVGNPAYVRFSPDGRYLAVSTYSANDEFRIYDFKAGRVIKQFDAAIFVHFPAADRLGFYRGEHYYVYSLPDFKIVSTATSAPYLSQALAAEWTRRYAKPLYAFSPDGTTKAVSNFTKPIITLQDTGSGEVIRTMHVKSVVTGLDFAPDGRSLAASHGDGAVRLWRIK